MEWFFLGLKEPGCYGFTLSLLWGDLRLFLVHRESVELLYNRNLLLDLRHLVLLSEVSE